jgi:hypothetical protein
MYCQVDNELCRLHACGVSVRRGRRPDRIKIAIRGEWHLLGVRTLIRLLRRLPTGAGDEAVWNSLLQPLTRFQRTKIAPISQ